MASTTKDLTKGTPWKLIVLFALPIMLSNLFQQLYNIIDSIIVGNFVSKEALAAVSSSGYLIFFFTSFFIGTASGAGVLIASYFGKNEHDNMRKAIHTDFAFGLASSLILTVAGIALTPTMLKLMDTDPTVLPESITYFRYYFIGITGNIMYNIMAGILQALGNSKRPLLYLIISSLLNVSLDLVFIIVFKLGVMGAALATCISQFVSALLCFLFLIRKGTVYQVRIREIRFHKDMLKKIVKYGVPAGIQNSVIGLANVFVQRAYNGFGADAMAACGAYSKLEGFAFLPITSFNLAVTNFVGQNLGAAQYERTKKGATFAIIVCVVCAEIMGIIMRLLSPYLIALFNQDPNVIALGTRQFKYITLFYFLLAFSHSVAAICRGAGKAIVPMSVMLIVWCVIRVTYILIITHYFPSNNIDNIVYVYMAYPITWSISSVIYFFYYKFSNWLHEFD